MDDANEESVNVAQREGTVGALSRELAAILSAANISEPKREAGDIIAAMLDVPRFWALLHEDETASIELAEQCHRAAQHWSAGAPFAYAVGRSAFRHLTLHVDERVLIPRQETELLVDEVLAREPTGLAIDIRDRIGRDRSVARERGALRSRDRHRYFERRNLGCAGEWRAAGVDIARARGMARRSVAGARGRRARARARE